VNWLARGFSYLTLDPSPRLRRLREESERVSSSLPPFGPLSPLPDSAYPPGAVPLDCSGVPDSDPREYGHRAADGTSRIHVPWSGWQRNDGQPYLREDEHHDR